MRGPCGGSVPAGITYATTAQNWAQALSTALTGCPTGVRCATQTVTIAAGAVGVDTTSGLYQVHIADGPNSEVVYVKRGSYPPTGATSGTIAFVPYFSHTSYTIESASSGIQETINLACGSSSTPYLNGQCNITIPANGGPDLNNGNPLGDHPLNNYLVYGTIFMHSRQSVLSGYGVSLDCVGRGPCLQMGDRLNANDYTDMTVKGIHFRTPISSVSNPEFVGSAITGIVVAGGSATITTAAAHGLRPGDLIAQLFTDNSTYWGDAVVTTVPSTTTYTIARAGSTTITTPGVVALAYEAVLDNANSSHFVDVGQEGIFAEVQRFNNFFDMWDDEQALIDHFDNNARPLNQNANWNGSFVFSGGGSNLGETLAPVITIRDSNFTANGSSCVTDYNSNGLYFENSVCQASGLWAVYSSNTTGNYQGAFLKNIYTEGTLPQNPTNGSPFGGLGISGLIAGRSTAAAHFEVVTGGGTGLTGLYPTGGSGATKYTYYIVANSGTGHTNPMRILDWRSTGSDSIPVSWPRVPGVTSYDVIRMTTPVNAGDQYPSTGNCLGGAGGACGSVATGLTQAAACTGNGGLICSYTDTGSSSTSAYTIKPGGAFTLNFWPGTIVTSGNTVSVDREPTNMVVVGMGEGTPALVSPYCSNYGIAATGGYTSCLANVGFSGPLVGTGTVLYDGAQQTLSKGRLNLFTPQSYQVNSHHFITLLDSQPNLTQSTIGYRPLASANDTYIGTDLGIGKLPSVGQLSFGAPVAISHYIANTGDGTSWLERLTSKQKTFAVPVRISDGNTFTLGDGSPLSQMKIYSIKNLPASHVPPQRCIDVDGEAKGLTKSDQITSITPPGRLGNLSLSAYASGEGTIILHFCNPSSSEATTPLGAYSFLAVH